jgi:hypothetical protein
VGPLLTGKLFGIGLKIGYVGIAFWVLAAVSVMGGLESWLLRDHI